MDYMSLLTNLNAINAMSQTISTIIWIATYVFFGFVFSTIAKKLNYEKPWLAWVPVAQMFLIPILAKKHWAWGFIFFVPIVGLVFYFMWMWNIYEQRKYPGWLSLIPVLMFIPILGLFLAPFVMIGQIIVLCLVAWSDKK